MSTRNSDAAPAGNELSQDAAALDARTSANDSRGTFDLPAWIAGHLELAPESRLLDLGCGTGKVLARYAHVLRPPGACTAADISEDSLARLAEEASRLRIPLTTRCLDMQRLAEADAEADLRELTHVTSVYSLYYASDPAALVRSLPRRLVADGTVVVVAPAPGNNAEWFGLLESAGVAVPEWIRLLGEHFLAREVAPAAESCFRESYAVQEESVVRFDAPEQVEEYWRSNIYYDAAASDRVSRAIDEHFRRENGFRITKRIGLVRMRSPR
jgi:SAM-dependent methyltransferase